MRGWVSPVSKPLVEGSLPLKFKKGAPSRKGCGVECALRGGDSHSGSAGTPGSKSTEQHVPKPTRALWVEFREFVFIRSCGVVFVR